MSVSLLQDTKPTSQDTKPPIDKKKVKMAEKLREKQLQRSGKVSTAAPTEQSAAALKQLFSSIPATRKTKEHMCKKLTPEQYLLYMEHQKTKTASAVSKEPKQAIPRARQNKEHNVIDVETQSERPAFLMPVLILSTKA